MISYGTFRIHYLLKRGNGKPLWYKGMPTLGTPTSKVYRDMAETAWQESKLMQNTVLLAFGIERFPLTGFAPIGYPHNIIRSQKLYGKRHEY